MIKGFKFRLYVTLIPIGGGQLSTEEDHQLPNPYVRLHPGYVNHSGKILKGSVGTIGTIFNDEVTVENIRFWDENGNPIGYYPVTILIKSDWFSQFGADSVL